MQLWQSHPPLLDGTLRNLEPDHDDRGGNSDEETEQEEKRKGVQESSAPTLPQLQKVRVGRQ